MADDGAPKTVSLEEYNTLKAELSQRDERAKRFESQLADLEKKHAKFKDVDLDRLRADSSALAELQRQRAAANPDDLKTWREEQKVSLRRELQTELEGLTAENKRLSTQNRELLIVDKAMAEIGPKFNEDGHVFIKQYIRESIDRDEAGNFVVKDNRGESRYSTKKPAEKLSLVEWAEELASKHPSIAKSTTVAGSKNPSLRQTNGTSQSLDVDRYLRMTDAERSALSVTDSGKLAIEAMKGIRVGRA